MENEKTARAVDKLDDEAAAAKSGLRPAYDAIAQMMREAVRGDARACECVLDAKKQWMEHMMLSGNMHRTIAEAVNAYVFRPTWRRS